MFRIPIAATALCCLLLAACGGHPKDGPAAKKDSTAAAAVAQPADTLLQMAGERVQPAGDMTIAYRFRAGESFGYTISSIEDVNETQDTVVNRNRQEVTYRYRFDVLEALPKGGARLRATCLGVSFKGSYTGGRGSREMRYDSKEKNSYDTEKLYAKYNAPVNTPYECTVTAEGRIESIGDIEPIIRRFLKDDYKSTQAAGKQAVTRDYSEAALRQVIQMAFQNVPLTPVNIDSTWRLSLPSQIGYLTVRNDAVYRLREVRKDATGQVALITSKLLSQYTGSKRLDTGQGMATVETFDVKGGGSSAMSLDLGRALRRRLRTDMHVRMFIEIPPDLKQAVPTMRDFWWVQKASIEHRVETLAL
jgi:hypothetical protein